MTTSPPPWASPRDRFQRETEAAMRSGNLPLAMQIARQALAQKIETPQFLTLAAADALNSGNATEALTLADRARELTPHVPDVLNLRGMALASLGRHAEAVRDFEAALRKAPGMAQIRFNRARSLEDMGQIVRARSEFERVIEAVPNHGEALAHLAGMAVQRGERDAARKLAERALRTGVGAIASHLAIAQCDIDEMKFAEALNRLSALAQSTQISPVNRAIVQGLMGDALEGLGRAADAFAAYTAANTTQIEYYRPICEAPGTERAMDRIQRLIEYFRKSDGTHWRSEAKGGTKFSHVFLVGFPRSGTTLLEQILDSHPSVASMEERECLFDAQQEYVFPADGLEKLAHASDAELERHRKLYWQHASAFGHNPKSGVFIDKFPLNLVLLPLIARLFPDARIILALRDPRDVVFSCFRRRFGMNGQMYELLTLAGAANYYAGVMTLAELYRPLLGLPICEIRYEDLVMNFEGQSRRICEFLGLEFEEGMRQFAEKSRARGVNTPSAAQVAKGLYTTGAGQWRLFAAQMASVLPTLAPWCARFGYGEE